MAPSRKLELRVSVAGGLTHRRRGVPSLAPVATESVAIIAIIAAIAAITASDRSPRSSDEPARKRIHASVHR